MAEDYSLAAKLLMVSGKLPGLTEGMIFYQTPTGEKVNSRTLASYLLAATIEDLKTRGFLEYKEDVIKAIGGTIPTLVLKKKKSGGVGFEKTVLDKLDKDKNITELVRDILGGTYEMPEYRLLWEEKSEFPEAEFMRKEKVTTMFIFSRFETRWIPEKVAPLADKWLDELKPVWDKVLALPWLKTAVRNCNMGYSVSLHQESPSDDKD
jgi:hypothetical protein